MTPFLSILIPTYNRPELTMEAVVSVGDNPDVEIIVVDDGSTRENQTLLADLLNPLILKGRVKSYENVANLGMVKNFNKCMEYATGVWYGIIGSDDIYLPGAIDSAVKMLKTLPGPSLVVHSRTTWFEVWMPGAYTVKGLKMPSGSGNFWHSDIVERLGGFDERLTFSPDAEYWYRMATKYPVVKCPQKYSKVREHSASLMWSLWRRKAEMFVQQKLLVETIMPYRGEDANDRDLVAANIAITLWDTVIYILKHTSTMPENYDIFDDYLTNAVTMANTDERKSLVSEYIAIRNKK